MMRSFDEILDLAAARKGGRDVVLASAAMPRTRDEVAAIPDHRWLAQMARGIFHAGISRRVVEAKWPGIEEAFQGFEVPALARMDDVCLDALVADPRVIRSRAKIAAIRDNAAFIARVSDQDGGFGRRVAAWPVSDFGGLVAWLAREGARLGGTTGQYVLRHLGMEGWVLTPSVVARLRAEGVIDGPVGSVRAARAIQSAFDTWRAESGQCLNVVSKVLALSIETPDG